MAEGTTDSAAVVNLEKPEQGELKSAEDSEFEEYVWVDGPDDTVATESSCQHSKHGSKASDILQVSPTATTKTRPRSDAVSSGSSSRPRFTGIAKVLRRHSS